MGNATPAPFGPGTRPGFWPRSHVGRAKDRGPSAIALDSRSAVSSVPFKLRLTLRKRAPAYLRGPQAAFCVASSQRRPRPARRRAKPFDQRFGAVDVGQTRLHAVEPAAV